MTPTTAGAPDHPTHRLGLLVRGRGQRLHQVGFRASFSGDHAWVSYDGEDNPPFHALEQALEPSSPYWYLYTPSFNDQRVIAGKTSLAANHAADQIIAAPQLGDCAVLVEDRDAECRFELHQLRQLGFTASPFASFGNSVSLTNNGRVAFTAGLDGGGEGVFLTDGATTTTIATTDHGGNLGHRLLRTGGQQQRSGRVPGV